MSSEHLVAFLESHPFQPFAMHLVDGREFEVRHKDFATVARGVLGVWYFHPTGEIEIIDTSLISSIRTLGPADLDSFSR